MLAPYFQQPELEDWGKQSTGELGRGAGLGEMPGEHPHPCSWLAVLPTAPCHSWEKAFD